MSSRKLTDMFIKGLKPKSNQYEVFDAALKGFAVRVSPGGTKAYIFVGRVRKRQIRMTMGSCSVISLKEARERAQEHARLMNRGIDPRLPQGCEGPRSVGDVVEQFIELYAIPNTKTAREAKRILDREVVSRWKLLPLSDLRRPAIVSALDEIARKSGRSSANHAFAAIRRVFSWAMQRGIVASSPCLGLRQPYRTAARHRTLSDDELASILRAANALGYPYGDFVKLACLTAQRRGEVSELMWADLNLKDRVWSQKTNKPERPHLLPLSGSAVELLQSIPVHGDLVFPSTAGIDRPISGFSKWKRSLDSLSNTENWTIHDLRRTAITNMGRLQVPPHVIDRILNHSSGSVRGLHGVYNLHEYFDEKREALDVWDRHLQSLASRDNR